MNPFFTPLNFPAFLTIATLSGCATTGDPDSSTAPTFAELQADLTDVADEMNTIQSQGVTPVAAFTNGNVTYSGFVEHYKGLSIIPPIPPTETVIGELTVTADFGTDDISVSIYNLVSDTRGPMPGTIGGDGEVVYVPTGEAANFTFDVTGSLLINGIPADYEGGLDGTFYGNTGPDLVFVGIDGTVYYLSGATEDFDMVGYGLAD